jgi:mycoredoxin
MNVTLYLTSWCPDSRAARRFLDSHGVEYTAIDIDKDREASALVVEKVGKRAIPQLVIDGAWFQPYVPGRGLLVDELHQRLRIPKKPA